MRSNQMDTLQVGCELKITEKAASGFKEMITPPNSRSPDFEEQIEAHGWWQIQDYRVGILPGLFKHQA